MKNKTIIMLMACTAIAVAGCVTKNPDYLPPPAGQGASNPQFVPNRAAISNAVATANGINDATAPLNPYPLPLRGLIEGIGSIALVISGVYANAKNKQAASKASALDTMAVGVIAAGPEAVLKVQQAAANSSTSDTAHILAAINDNSA